jgi:hypothetical protein
MNTTDTTTVPTPTEMPVIDSPLDPEVADQLGDEILLSAVRSVKPHRVRKGAGQRFQPATVRAWSAGGRVD